MSNKTTTISTCIAQEERDHTAFNVSGFGIKDAIINRAALLKGCHTCCLNANVTLLNLAKFGDYKGIRGLANCPDDILDINVQDRKGRTGLFLSSFMGHANAVKEFISIQNINVNKRNILTGETPYAIASKKSHLDVMKIISQHKNVDVNEGWTLDSWTTSFDVWHQISSLHEKLATSSRLITSEVAEGGKKNRKNFISLYKKIVEGVVR